MLCCVRSDCRIFLFLLCSILSKCASSFNHKRRVPLELLQLQKICSLLHTTFSSSPRSLGSLSSYCAARFCHSFFVLNFSCASASKAEEKELKKQFCLFTSSSNFSLNLCGASTVVSSPSVSVLTLVVVVGRHYRQQLPVRTDNGEG